MSWLDRLLPRPRFDTPLDVPPRGTAWNESLDVEARSGHVAIWPAADDKAMSGCFRPDAPVYHAAVVFALGTLAKHDPSPPGTDAVRRFLESELKCMAAGFGLDAPVEFDGKRLPGGLRKTDFLERDGLHSDFYEFSVNTRSWMGPENHERKTLKRLQRHGERFATADFLVPRTTSLRPHHELALDGLVRVSVPLEDRHRSVLLAWGAGSRFTEGYLEADNWPRIKPEVSGFLYETRWRWK